MYLDADFHLIYSSNIFELFLVEGSRQYFWLCKKEVPIQEP